MIPDCAQEVTENVSPQYVIVVISEGVHDWAEGTKGAACREYFVSARALDQPFNVAADAFAAVSVHSHPRRTRQRGTFDLKRRSILA
jgi:hypothetical protein